MMVQRRTLLKALGLFVGVVLLVLGGTAWYYYGQIKKAASDDPLVWEKDIRAFEAAAAQTPPPVDAVLFVGSSSIRLWNSLAQDMQPIPVIRRGFGGAKLNDLVHYSERLVNVYQPRAVVVFAGTNDITVEVAKEPAQLLQSYWEFVARVRAGLGEVPIYYIAITPSARRWPVWSIAQETNALIKDYTASSEGLRFIDTGPALLDPHGEPDADNYRFDGLHLSDRGYAIWRNIIRSRLLADLPEYQLEKSP